MSDNLGLWHKLERTDPSQTKGFQRPGGFRGTAVKPIYCVKRMTEAFGQCGVGWGTDAPQWSIQGDAVFCTVGLWTGSPEAPGRVYGVGGDIIVKRFKDGGDRYDDEAFKKAFTDALTNAMKHLGMSADVHMGLFDDSKYVAELKQEARSNGSARNAPSPSTRPHEPAESPADPEAKAATGQQREWSKAEVEKRGKEIAAALRDHDDSVANLSWCWQQNEVEIMTMPVPAQKGLRKVFETEYAKIEAAKGEDDAEAKDELTGELLV